MQTKKCKICGLEYPITIDYFYKSRKYYIGICKNCYCMRQKNKYAINYNNYRDIIKQKSKLKHYNLYHNNLSYKQKLLNQHKLRLSTDVEYKHKRNICTKNWIKNHREQFNCAMRRANNKRHRNLGGLRKAENIINESTVEHHINDKEIINIPVDLHELYHGSQEYHRFMVNQIVEQIYNIKIRR